MTSNPQSDSRPRWPALLLGGLFGLAGLNYVGCEAPAPPPKPAAEGDAKPVAELDKDSRTAAPPKLFAGWGEPTFTLVLSGEQHGYIEPCGCSETQSGGLARRADLFQQIRDRGWPVAGVDLGGLGRHDRLSRGQERRKFTEVMKALGTLGYEAVALGYEELRIEQLENYFLVGSLNIGPDGEPTLPFLSANVTPNPDFGPDYEPERLRVFDVGSESGGEAGGTVAVTAVLGKGFHEELLRDDPSSTIAFEDPAAALEKIAGDIEAADADLTVLLAHAEKAEAAELAAAFPQFDIVVACGNEEPEPAPTTIDGRLLVTLGHKGKNVGVVGVFADADTPADRLRLEVVDLDKDRFAEHPSMIAMMRDYQTALEQEGFATSPSMTIPHPAEGAGYVGAKVCGECHTKAYAKWRTSKHAHAFDSLEKGREGKEDTWVSRIHDPECLACHVTGWNPQKALRFDGGFLSQGETPHLVGQQCENCHGPGAAHTKTERMWDNDPQSVSQRELALSRRAVTLDVATAERQVCLKCDDGENSPDFDFKTYWEKVKHPGKD